MKVAILDCGAQYAKVIDRRVRELNIESDILPLDTGTETLHNYGAIIISGGPASVYGKNAPKYNKELFTLGIPVLGICYGMQLLNVLSGGTIKRKSRREDGETTISVSSSPLFKQLKTEQQVLMSHGDSLDKIAPGFTSIAASQDIVAAIQQKEKKLYGVQFHPEVDLTVNGKIILKNFLFTIAKLKPTYTIKNRISQVVKDIQDTVQDKKVLALVSGGVDSSVTAALLLKALSHEQVYAIHVDSGLMRMNESAVVVKALKVLGMKNLDRVNASKQFLQALKGKKDPEQKRKIIGDLFMKIVDQEIKRLKLDPNTTFLAQGTLRPDLIESASSLVTDVADTIKTHHNDTALVREKRKKGLVIETNKDWHKDEVREVGRRLGLPNELIDRHPFPGPGLAVRILCATKPYLKDFDKVNKKVKDFAFKHGFVGCILPVRTVGVQGDERSYKYLAVLSGKGHFPTLKAVANELPKVIHEVNRVVYLFDKQITVPEKSITPTTITKDVIALLQKADVIVNSTLRKYKVMGNIAQMPVVLFPATMKKGRMIALRPFVTNDFMTGRPAVFGKDLPVNCIKEMVQKIYKLPGVCAVVYDLSSKPPGTTEWE